MQSFLFIFLFFVIPINLSANINLFKQADLYARSGDIRGMLSTYQKVLIEDPDNIRALNGKGTALSWLKEFKKSQQVFIYGLTLEPNNKETLKGLGYSYAWDRQFNRAKITFQHVLALDSSDLSANKGYALTHLWAGEYRKAILLLKEIETKYPGDAEIYAAIGQSHLHLEQTRRAYDYFKKSLTYEENRADALSGIQSAYKQPAKISLSTWYGTSSDGDSGFRLIDASYWFNKKTKGFLIYDNSLSLDNPSLARNDENAESYEAGIFHTLSRQWVSTLSIGYRDLPDKQHQNFYKAEIAKFFSQSIIKAGAQISPHSDDFTDHVYHFTYSLPASEKLRIEPALYLSETGATNDDEWRAVINLDFVSDSGWELNFSTGYGEIDSQIDDVSGSVKVISSALTFPIGFHRLHLRGRYEDNPTNDFSVLMVGFTARLPHK